MGAHRQRTDMKLGGDLFARQPAREQKNDLTLSRREPVGKRKRRRRQ